MCKLVGITSNSGEIIEVAEIKQNYIQNIISSATKCKFIEAVILFESALEERCTDKSDIDIAIISKYTVNRLCRIKSYSKFIENIYAFDLSQEYDKLYFKSISEIEQKQDDAHICKELVEKGKTIYRNTIQTAIHVTKNWHQLLAKQGIK